MAEFEFQLKSIVSCYEGTKLRNSNLTKIFNIVIDGVNRIMSDKMKMYFFQICLYDDFFYEKYHGSTYGLAELICKGICNYKSYNLVYETFYDYYQTQFEASFEQYKDVLIDNGWYYLSHVYDIIEDEINEIKNVDEKNIRLFIAAKAYCDMKGYLLDILYGFPF